MYVCAIKFNDYFYLELTAPVFQLFEKPRIAILPYLHLTVAFPFPSDSKYYEYYNNKISHILWINKKPQMRPYISSSQVNYEWFYEKHRSTYSALKSPTSVISLSKARSLEDLLPGLFYRARCISFFSLGWEIYYILY